MSDLLIAAANNGLLRGAAFGLAGAFLVFAASFFIPVGIALEKTTWVRKLLFLCGGTVMGAVFAPIEVFDSGDVDDLVSVALGAAWLHATQVLIAGGKAVANGWRLQRLGDVDVNELIRLTQEARAEPGTGGGP